MTDQVIGRRKALQYVSLLAATAAGQEFLSGWLTAAEGPSSALASQTGEKSLAPSAPFSPKFFSPEQYRAVEILTELIIPTDDQPGAKEAKVAQFIDFVVFSAAQHLPQLQLDWKQGLAQLDQLSKQKNGRGFCNLTAAQQEALLIEMSLPERDSQATHPGYNFFRQVKQMTVEGFYTSKVGLVDVLGYQGRTYLSEFPGCTHPEHQA